MLQLLRHRADMVLQRLGVGIFVQEDQRAQHLAAHADERAARHVEIDEIALVAHRHQLPVERIAPPVIAADKAARLARFLGHQRGAAMLAGVVERLDLAIHGARDDDRRSGVMRQEPAAVFGHLIGVSDIAPRPLPHALFLKVEECGIGIAASGNIGQRREIVGRRFARPFEFHHFLHLRDRVAVEFHGLCAPSSCPIIATTG